MVYWLRGYGRMPYPPNLKSVGDSSLQEGSVCSAYSVGDYLSGCVGMAGMPYPPMLAEHFDSL